MPVLRVVQGKSRWELTFMGQPTLSDVLTAHGIAMAHPCGGRGTCGKCAVEARGAVSPANEAERRAGTRLSCQIALLGDCEIVLREALPMEQIEGADENDGGPPVQASVNARMGAAVDIGTTTLALRLYNLETGAVAASSAAANPQISVAADVMGRIGASLQGNGEGLKRQITEAVEELLRQACETAGCPAGSVERLVIAGNTTMLYLLTGRNPESLSHAPFQADCLFGHTESLLGRNAYLPVCMNAFVGADITCAVLASGMCRQPECSLLCDIGTNGEMALWKNGVLYVTSTAAGPAFEGAGIEMGCGSVRGAIDKVWAESGSLGVHTIGNAPAVGICGSGLIDAVATLLQLERVDETGATDEERMELANGVALFPKDIRNVQLAKAAIAAGMETLMKQAEVRPQDIARLYIAGGFGNHLDMRSAAAIGLIPAALISKAVSIGNGSLAGASAILLDDAQRAETERIAAASRHVSLGGCPVFNQAYMERMVFPVSL